MPEHCQGELYSMPIVVADVLLDFTIALERDFPAGGATDNRIVVGVVVAAQSAGEHGQSVP